MPGARKGPIFVYQVINTLDWLLVAPGRCGRTKGSRATALHE